MNDESIITQIQLPVPFGVYKPFLVRSVLDNCPYDLAKTSKMGLRKILVIIFPSVRDVIASIRHKIHGICTCTFAYLLDPYQV